MKVINKSEIKDEKWCVGDVIAFKANKILIWQQRSKQKGS